MSSGGFSMVRNRRSMLSGVLAVFCAVTLFEAPVANGSISPDGVVSAVDPGAVARKLVRRLAGKDPRAAVRADAWVAWAEETPEAVEDFLDTGLAAAVRRAAESGAANTDFCNRVLLTYTTEYAPEVNAAAVRALRGTDGDREIFVRQGFAQAEARDRLAREADGGQREALAEEDRRYVRTLAANDPGSQVRLAAAFAVRPGATDADIVDFFAYGWATGAQLDLEMHRLRDAEQEARWQSAITRLITDATEAERVALEASGEAAVRLREAAARAWQQVGGQTVAPRTAWADAGEVAVAQAANWAAVAAAARSATGPNWQAMKDAADRTGGEWVLEQDWARQQAEFWKDLFAQALAGETRMRDPGN